MVWHNEQVSDRETEEIIRRVKECLAIQGDLVELGCYRGDTSLVLAELLKEYNNKLVEKPVKKSVKKLWIYDSFEGLPDKTLNDESAVGKDFRSGALAVSKKEVKKRFLRAGLPVPMICKGWFGDLTEEDLPEEVAFAFLDGDFYESIRDSLRLVGSKMCPGGVMMVHDYRNEALPGVAKAVDEWLSEKSCQVEWFETCAIIKI